MNVSMSKLLYLIILPLFSFSQASFNELLDVLEKNNNFTEFMNTHGCEIESGIDGIAEITHFIYSYHHLSNWRYQRIKFKCPNAIYELELQDALIMEDNWYKTIIIRVGEESPYYQKLLTEIKQSSIYQGPTTWETASREEKPGMRFFLPKKELSKVHKGFYISIETASSSSWLEIRIAAKGWEHSSDQSRQLLEQIN